MRSREDRDAAFLRDIREACSKIVKRLKNRKFPDFIAGEELRDGIVLQLIIIGEASRQLTDKTRTLYPKVPWKEMIGIRNVLTHSYWSTDILKIWETASHDIPELLELLTR
jgi:uncharacterized protein with HEPN domain